MPRKHNKNGTFTRIYSRNIVPCKCGCGEKILEFNGKHHKKYIIGHQKRGVPTRHSPEVLKRISESNKRKASGDKNYFFGKRFCGKEHPSWAGGKWSWAKRKTLLRDNFTCIQCGLKDKDIVQVDHIVPLGGKDRNKVTHDPNNLQTLCPNCHARKTLKELRLKRKK